MKKYLVSTATLPLAENKAFHEYASIPEAFNRLAADGIELVFLPEWGELPLRTPTSADMEHASKAGVGEVAEFIRKSGIKVPSVHINRDVGNWLSGSEDEKAIGKKILEENLIVASVLGAEIAVLHLWDTYKAELDIAALYLEIAPLVVRFPVKLAIENIPISAKHISQRKAWEILSPLLPEDHGFTLDLNWCSLYDNFEELREFSDKILNVHVQGCIENGRLVPRTGKLDILECLRKLSADYRGFITLELVRVRGIEDFLAALELIKCAGGIEYFPCHV